MVPTRPQIGSDEGEHPAHIEGQVLVAVALGWQVAEFYCELDPSSATGDDEGTEALPGLSRLNAAELRTLRIHQIEVALRQLRPVLSGAGLAVPGTTSLRAAGDERNGATSHSSNGSGSPATSRSERQEALASLHVDLLTSLTAADFRVGKSYSLGHGLAGLCLRPEVKDPESLRHHLAGRLDALTGWLRELKSLLPHHAAEAVCGSLSQWDEWAGSTNAADPSWGDNGVEVRRALRAQGNRWRAVLSGEKTATDLLSAHDYVKAGEALLQRFRALGQGFFAQYWPLVLGVGVMAAGMVLLGLLSDQDAAGVVASLAGVVGGLGFTWKTTAATLGDVVAKAGDSLWQAQLDVAITKAATVLPGERMAVVAVPRPIISVVTRRKAAERPTVVVTPATAA